MRARQQNYMYRWVRWTLKNHTLIVLTKTLFYQHENYLMRYINIFINKIKRI